MGYLLTLMAIAEQTKQTAKAAKAAQASAAASERSIELQEIQFGQWVEFGEWKTEAVRQDDGTIILPDGNVLLGIQCYLVNPTKTPLTLLEFNVAVGRESFSQKEHVTLFPCKPWCFPFSVLLTPDRFTQWRDSILKLTIISSVSYEDQLKRKHTPSLRRNFDLQ